jgi:5'-nucleotidase
MMAVAILMLTAGSVSANAATAADLDDSYSGKTVILQSNDVHGALEGYQYIAGLRDELVKRGADVVMVDSGDFMQGSTYVADSKGLNAVRMMNECGYEYITVGNHEFDYDTIRLLRNLGKLNASVLSSNIIDEKAHDRVFESTALYSSTDSDLKIGFYGEGTPQTATYSIPGNLKGLRFITDEQEMYGTAKADIDSLEEKGADIIICLSHLGIDDVSKPYVSYNLYENTKSSIGTGAGSLTEDSIKEKYIILDGHSHTVMEHGSNGEPIMQTGTKFMNIGVVVIDEKTEKIEKNFLYRLRETDSESAKFLEGLYSNKKVEELSDEIESEIDIKYSEKIGETAVDLNGQ